MDFLICILLDDAGDAAGAGRRNKNWLAATTTAEGTLTSQQNINVTHAHAHTGSPGLAWNIIHQSVLDRIVLLIRPHHKPRLAVGVSVCVYVSFFFYVFYVSANPSSRSMCC